MPNHGDVSAAIQPYRELEARVRASDLDGLLARWAFGRALLAEREANGGNKLPDGRLSGLANALAISRTEIKNRMRFAEEYPADEDVRALNGVPWREVCGSLGRRGAEGDDEPHEGAEAAVAGDGGDEEADDAFRVPNRLRERLARVTREAYAGGRAEGDNYLGYGVEALLDFVEAGGRDAWAEWLRPRPTLAEVA